MDKKSKVIFGEAQSVVADTNKSSAPALIRGRAQKITKAQMRKAQNDKNLRTTNNKALPSNKVVGIKPGK